VLVPEVFPQWISYVCFQSEIGENGTLHLQGYLECIGVRSLKQLLAVPGFDTQDEGYSVHLEVRRGTQKQAVEYCKKQDDTTIAGTFEEHGEMKEQGKRSDLNDVKEKVDKMISLKRIHDENFGTMIRYGRAIKEYKRQVTKPRNFPTITILLVGPSGVGKSRFATEFCKLLGTVYKVPKPKNSGLYWDDYDGETVTFLDEFDGNYMRPTDFNELADRYEYVVPVHGGAGHQFVSKYLVICSNYLPKYWWKKRSAVQLVQTTRRINAMIPLIPASSKVPEVMVLHNGTLIAKSKNLIL